MTYPWYQELEVEENEIQQGDFIPECPIVIPPSKFNEDQSVDIEIMLVDAVVLSQTCDLVHKKVDIVLVCPYYSLKDWISRLPEGQNKGKGLKRTLEDLRKGHLPSYHLLSKSDDINDVEDFQVVDFKNVYGIKVELLNELVNGMKSRLRLLPPYREHLSQAFARYFMRVGLPQDLVLSDYQV